MKKVIKKFHLEHEIQCFTPFFLQIDGIQRITDIIEMLNISETRISDTKLLWLHIHGALIDFPYQ